MYENAIIIHLDGKIEVVEGPTTEFEDTGTEPDGSWLRKQLACEYLQMVPLHQLGELWCDEEGKGAQAHNAVATAALAQWLLPGDFIVGTVVIYAPLPSETALQLLQRNL